MFIFLLCNYFHTSTRPSDLTFVTTEVFGGVFFMENLYGEKEDVMGQNLACFGHTTKEAAAVQWQRRDKG